MAHCFPWIGQQASGEYSRPQEARRSLHAERSFSRALSAGLSQLWATGKGSRSASAKDLNRRSSDSSLEDSSLDAAATAVASATKNQAVPTPTPATAWLQRTSTPNLHVPAVSEAALVDRIERRPERVTVLAVRAAPPAENQGVPLQSWCSALHLSGTVAPLLNTPLPSDYTHLLESLLQHSGLELQAALRQAALTAWEGASPGTHQVAAAGRQQQEAAAAGRQQQEAAAAGRQQQEAAAGGTTVMVPITGLDFGLTLAITPFLIKACKGPSQPALFIEHLFEHHEAKVEQQLRYKDMLLSRTPAILTICDLQGHVLHQNAASIQYAGNRIPAITPTSSARPTYNYLKQALQLEPDDLLDEILEELAMGCEWSSSCVKVPFSLNDSEPPCGNGQPTSPDLNHMESMCSSHADIFSTREWNNNNGTRTPSRRWSLQTPVQQMLGHSTDSSNTLGAAAGLGAGLMSSGYHQHRHSTGYEPPAGKPPLQKAKVRHNSALVLSSQENIGMGQGQHSASTPSSATGNNRKAVRPAASRLHLLMSGSKTPPSRGTSGTSMSTHRSKSSNLVDDPLQLASPVTPLGPRAGHPLSTSTDTTEQLKEHTWKAPKFSTDDYFFPSAAGRSKLDTIRSWAPETGVLMSNGMLASAHGSQRGRLDNKGEDAMGQGQASETCWHEIKAWPAIDPTTGATLVVISQVDVTERIQSEMRMTKVSEACVSLLELMFPRHVIEHLAVNPSIQPTSDGTATAIGGNAMLDQLATKHECVTLFFCDIVGFTTMSKEVEPVQVMQFLNSLYSAYDELVDEFGVYKVETVGDCYVVAGGLMTQDEEGFACVDREGRNDGTSHALAVYRFAQAVLRVAANTPMPHNGQPVQIRIGLHSGPITSGIIGHRMPKFCLFGDSMNTCSRMETTAPYGSIHLSQATYELLAEQQAAEGLVCTGGVEVKGKGRMITYVYKPEENLNGQATQVSYVPITRQTGNALPKSTSFDLSRMVAAGRSVSGEREQTMDAHSLSQHSDGRALKPWRSRGTSRMGQQAFSSVDPTSKSGNFAVTPTANLSGSFIVAAQAAQRVRKSTTGGLPGDKVGTPHACSRAQPPRHPSLPAFPAQAQTPQPNLLKQPSGIAPDLLLSRPSIPVAGGAYASAVNGELDSGNLEQFLQSTPGRDRLIGVVSNLHQQRPPLLQHAHQRLQATMQHQSNHNQNQEHARRIQPGSWDDVPAEKRLPAAARAAGSGNRRASLAAYGTLTTLLSNLQLPTGLVQATASSTFREAEAATHRPRERVAMSGANAVRRFGWGEDSTEPDTVEGDLGSMIGRPKSRRSSVGPTLAR